MKRIFSFSHSKGQMIVLYAGIVAALLGATALCTDVSMMYLNSIQVQKAADSAAIAGAEYLNGNTFSGAVTGCTSQADDAKKAACSFAAQNGLAVDSTNLTLTEPTASTIHVVAQRTGLPYYFGKVVGLSTYDVSAASTGQASLAVQKVTIGMFPVGLQCTAPCDLSLLDPGQSVSFGKKFVGGLAPGNWQWLAIGGTGSSTLGANINNGVSGSFAIGDSISSGPGNKGNSNPVNSGLSSRLSRCSSIADPCTSAGGDPRNIPKDDPCLVIVPAVDYHGCNGSCSMTIEGFALIYIEPSATTSTDIEGCFVQQVVPNTVTSITAPKLGPQQPPTLIN